MAKIIPKLTIILALISIRYKFSGLHQLDLNSRMFSDSSYNNPDDTESTQMDEVECFDTSSILMVLKQYAQQQNINLPDNIEVGDCKQSVTANVFDTYKVKLNVDNEECNLTFSSELGVKLDNGIVHNDGKLTDELSICAEKLNKYDEQEIENINIDEKLVETSQDHKSTDSLDHMAITCEKKYEVLNLIIAKAHEADLLLPNDIEITTCDDYISKDVVFYTVNFKRNDKTCKLFLETTFDISDGYPSEKAKRYFISDVRNCIYELNYEKCDEADQYYHEFTEFYFQRNPNYTEDIILLGCYTADTKDYRKRLFNIAINDIECEIDMRSDKSVSGILLSHDHLQLLEDGTKDCHRRVEEANIARELKEKERQELNDKLAMIGDKMINDEASPEEEEFYFQNTSLELKRSDGIVEEKHEFDSDEYLELPVLKRHKKVYEKDSESSDEDFELPQLIKQNANKKYGSNYPLKLPKINIIPPLNETTNAYNDVPLSHDNETRPAIDKNDFKLLKPLDGGNQDADWTIGSKIYAQLIIRDMLQGKIISSQNIVSVKSQVTFGMHYMVIYAIGDVECEIQVQEVPYVSTYIIYHDNAKSNKTSGDFTKTLEYSPYKKTNCVDVFKTEMGVYKLEDDQ